MLEIGHRKPGSFFFSHFFLAFTVSGSRGKGDYTGAEAGWVVVAALPMLHSVPDLKTAKAPSVAGHGGNKGGRREFGICGNVEMGRGHLVVGEGDWRGNEGSGAGEVRC